jgi:CRP-like cAMP-binding protein
MRAALLKQFDDFADLDTEALRAVARSSRAIRLAANRWLARAGRHPHGRYYLLEGRVRLAGGETVSHDSLRARRRLYPGCHEIRTLSPVLLVHVDWEAVEFLAGDRKGLPTELPPGWEEAFLSLPVMRRLSPADWYRVLKSLRPRPVAAHVQVVSKGQPGQQSFVLAAGSAAVLDGARQLLLHGPGGLFGEDAPILGAPRNATVQMCEPGVVLCMPRSILVSVLLAAAVRTPRRVIETIPLHVGSTRSGPGLHLPLSELRHAAPLLDRGCTYAVLGGLPAERLLACFLLVQAGVDAVIPERCAESGGHGAAVGPGAQ